ncbi:hypothetical protein [Friedmanniella luteola]|uniref:hypothetical protein n=1 Tax=Friedmanniella luteola TaxID=546871 RepID=UPI000B8A4C73|nr:hypothetical protein [Friedmanniella luteola]
MDPSEEQAAGPGPGQPPVLFLNGSYGVGKSATLEHLGDLLAERGLAFSLMDVDWFHRSWPPAEDDPENVRTEAANLAAVWRNYRRTGPRQLVVAGVIADERDRQRYAAAFALPLRSVRLVTEPAVAEVRLRGRYRAQQDRALAWHLARHVQLARRLAENALDEHVVDTGGRGPRDVAEAVLAQVGLPGPVPSARRDDPGRSSARDVENGRTAPSPG